MLQISTRLIAEEAARRGWKVEPLDARFSSALAITPPNGRTYYFESCQPPLTSASAMKIADNKLATYLIAQRLGLPVANFEMYNPQTAAAFLKNNNEIVVKPTDTNHGDGITVGVKTAAALEDAVTFAKQFSDTVLLQARVYGQDCRVVVVDGKPVAATLRTPAHVVGDGVQTITELIHAKNNEPGRAHGHTTEVPAIDTAAATRHLGPRITDVPAPGERVEVLATANVSKGGEAEDITNTIHPSFAAAAVKIAGALDMFLCGVDFLTDDITKPFVAQSGILLEINATPALRLHHHPTHGQKRDVAKAILDAFSKKIAGTIG